MKNPLIKISILLFGFITFISNVFAETSNSIKEPKITDVMHKVLFVSTAHSNTAKITLLKKVAKQKTKTSWAITQKSAKSLRDTVNKAESLALLFNQYDLVILDAVSAREASATFDSYENVMT